MLIRRCAALHIEPRERSHFDLDDLLSGGSGWTNSQHLVALAAHLEQPVEVSPDDLAVLGRISALRWSDPDTLSPPLDPASIDRLNAAGLLLQQDDSALTQRDQDVRDSGWYASAAILHLHGRWENTDGRATARELLESTGGSLASVLGEPPPAVANRGEGERGHVLPPPASTALDAVLSRRVTCRNFAAQVPVELEKLSTVLWRAFGAQAVDRTLTGHDLLKKMAPSAGGLHPTQAYVWLRACDGLADGLYCYQPVEHRLDPLPVPGQDLDQAWALHALAGQDYFANAPVLIFISSRFERNFWKYREHSKAYRAVLLDVGHVSQLLYLSATEQGLGCFITSAVNDKPIEAILGLDPIREGIIAVSGLGYRHTDRASIEFDPLHRVWADVSSAGSGSE